MKKVKLLDCTLRDGGYINNWNFGKENIIKVNKLLEESGVDILEVGFLRDEHYNTDRTIFNSMDQFHVLVPKKNKNISYTMMLESMKPFPIDLLPKRSEKTIDAVRVMVWKNMHDKNGNVVDCLKSGYDICKKIADKGYEVYVQPVRVEQYSDEDFIDMVKLFCDLNPRAFYIVDSWGTMYGDDVNHYLKLADQYLPKDVAIGYHSHNNMMQAFSNAIEYVNYSVDRELILDASVYGIGRGAGNLNTEIIAKYLNEREGRNYIVHSFLKIYEECIKDIYKEHKWGYSPVYFMTAAHHTNPQYGTYYSIDHDISSTIVDCILDELTDYEKIMYTSGVAQKCYDDYMNKHGLR